MAFPTSSVVLAMYCSSTETPLSSNHLQSPKMIQGGYYRLSLHEQFHSDNKSSVTHNSLVLHPLCSCLHSSVSDFYRSGQVLYQCTSLIRWEFCRRLYKSQFTYQAFGLFLEARKLREVPASRWKGCLSHKVTAATSSLPWQQTPQQMGWMAHGDLKSLGAWRSGPRGREWTVPSKAHKHFWCSNLNL